MATIFNVLLNYLLIFGNFGFWRLEVSGVALATVVSLTFNLVLYIFISNKEIKPIERLRANLAQMRLILKESRFLVGQELLEGSIFIIGTNALLSRINMLENYIQIMPIVSVVFIAMHMYSTAVLTLLSRNSASGTKAYLLNLPKVAAKIASLISLILGIFFLFLRFEVIYLLSPDAEFSYFTAGLLGMTLLANSLSPVYNIYRSALQALAESDYVLYRTFFVNVGSFILVLVLVLFWEFGYEALMGGIFFNYLVLSILFYLKYARKVRNEAIL